MQDQWFDHQSVYGTQNKKKPMYLCTPFIFHSSSVAKLLMSGTRGAMVSKIMINMDGYVNQAIHTPGPDLSLVGTMNEVY